MKKKYDVNATKEGSPRDQPGEDSAADMDGGGVPSDPVQMQVGVRIWKT